MKAWVLFKRDSKTNYQDKFLAFWMQKPKISEVESLIHHNFPITTSAIRENVEYRIEDSEYFFKVCKEDTLYDR